MSTQTLYRKWRSQDFAEVVGQEHITGTLRNALVTERIAHAYLFCGPRGTGKTSTARILAKAVNCLSSDKGEPCNTCTMCRAITEGRALDLIEIDAASNRGIDEIRDLREKVRFSPNEARRKFYIIDEVHMLTSEAFNALLKTLEEPPPHAMFVLATTEAHKVPATIASRCQRFDFRRIPLAASVGRLRQIAEAEGFQVEPAALEILAKNASGSLRDAENLLDQLVAYFGREITVAQVHGLLGITGDQRVRELARAALNKDVTAGLRLIAAVAADGVDLRQFNRELIEFLRGVLLTNLQAADLLDMSQETLAEMRQLAQDSSPTELVRAIKLFGQADVRNEVQASLPLELALVEQCVQPGPSAVRAPQVEQATRARVAAVPPSPGDERDERSNRPLTTPPHRVEVPPVPSEKAREQAAAPTQQPKSDAPPEVINLEAPGDLLSVWPRVLEAIRTTNKNVAALLNGSCQPAGLEGETVVLEFYFSYHSDRVMNDPKNRHTLEEALSKVLGRNYQVKSVLRPRERKARGKSAAEDATVRAALEIFDARIVDDDQ
ncbi:MAG: DNA polymerase III subunit gamma/tau [Chloroflexota bacterium]|nr:MAG: DNA polymerase III subunit gamma/tau [Chloroflexota bacterium]